MTDARSTLLTISHAIGSNPELVQGGGGNTSVKDDEGRVFIKASGTTLRAMSDERGYVVLDRAGTVVDAHGNQRPSMELFMHLFLPRVVLHTHAVNVNVFNCMKDGQERLTALFPNLRTVCVPYRTPGRPLADEIQQIVQEYRKEAGTFPEVLFLENHGMITTHDDPDRALALTVMVSATVKALLTKQLGNTFVPFTPEQFSRDRAPHGCLFPDAAVFSATGQTPAIKEILAAEHFLETTIPQLGGVCQYLGSRDVAELQALESEQYRQKIAGV